MGGTPLLLALALVLVDYGWESDGRDGFRYIVQIPEEQFDAIEKGGVITSQIPEEIRGQVSSIEIWVGQRPLPKTSVNKTVQSIGAADVASAESRVETVYPAPPDTPVPTVRGQGEDTLRIPTLSDLQAAGQDLVDGLSTETKQQISDAAKEAQQNLQRTLRDGTQASADYLTTEAQKLLAVDGSTTAPSSRLSPPPSSSPTAFSTPPSQGSASSVSAAPTTASSGWGTTAPTASGSSTLTLNPSGTAPTTSPSPGSGIPSTFSGSTTYPQGGSSTYNPGNIPVSTTSGGFGGTTPTTNPATASGLPNYSTGSGGYPTTNNSTVPQINTTSNTSLAVQDYWSLQRALTKDQQAERDARLLNEVGIGPGEVFIELKSQKELPRTDPRYAAMTDYMNRYYTYQRANSISSSASTLANPVSTASTPTSGSYVGGNNPSFNQNNPLNNMTFSTPGPTTNPSTNPSTNPYFGGNGNRVGTTTPTDAWEEVVRRRAEEMLLWEANNPRLAQNASTTNGGLTGPVSGGGNLGMPPSIAQGNQTTPTANPTQGTGGASLNGNAAASASDQKEVAGGVDTKRREYQPQALVNFFLLLSLVGNIYLGIAISRLIRRYRNLVAVHRNTAALSV